MSNNFLWGKDNDWNFDMIDKTHKVLSDIVDKKYQLDTYPSQIELITADQMLDAYSSIGMPLMYNHWSFGKEYTRNYKSYKRGHMGLAYEIVINSNPCIAYLMEENTATMQALVIAHACFGHSSFFRNNYLFKQHTDASYIIDYLLFARKYIRHCEERYGEEAVETLLDSCHSIMHYGVDRYKKAPKLSLEEEENRQKERANYYQSQISDLWRYSIDKKTTKKSVFPEEPTENILYFLEKNSPVLESWQREILRIIRKIAQYFYPQRQTSVMNEGWATFWHYHLMHDLYDEGHISEGSVLEFLKSHSGVINQYEWNHPGYPGMNIYTLGFYMFRDIKRICQNPTVEDKKWFPEIAGSDWLTTLKFIMENYRDESFILEFLSPKVIRDLKLFAITQYKKDKFKYIVTDIHDDIGYREIRKALSQQYDLSMRDPDIHVQKVRKDDDRAMFLMHQRYQGVTINKDVHEVLKHIKRLWGFDIYLKSMNTNTDDATFFQCTSKAD